MEEVLLVRSDAGRAVEDPAFREFVVGLTDQLRGLGARVVVGSASFYDEGEEALISADRRTAVLRFTLADVFQIGEFFGNVRFFLDENPGFGVLAVEQPTAGRVQEIVIVRSESGTVDDAAFQTLVEDLFFELIALGSDVVQRGTHYYLAGDEGLVSADRSTTLLPLNVNEDEVEQVLDVVQRFRGAEGFELLITGPAIVDLEFEETAESDLVTGELQFGLPIAVVVLLLVFGAVVAAALPLVLALTAIMIALGVAALLGQAFDLSIFITNMVFMIGLAVGIDYSLFIVARYREERGAGRAQAEAIARAGGTAGAGGAVQRDRRRAGADRDGAGPGDDVYLVGHGGDRGGVGVGSGVADSAAGGAEFVGRPGERPAGPAGLAFAGRSASGACRGDVGPGGADRDEGARGQLAGSGRAVGGADRASVLAEYGVERRGELARWLRVEGWVPGSAARLCGGAG